MKTIVFDNAMFETKKMLFEEQNPIIDEKVFIRPITLNRRFGLSMYMARKVIKTLFETEYLDKVMFDGGCTEDGEYFAPWNGYVLTKEGFEKLKKKFDIW